MLKIRIYFFSYNGTYRVSGIGTCRDTAIVISATYNGRSVTSIDYMAFYGCKTLTSVVIPDSVTSIGEYAFYYCRNLNSIQFNGTIAEWKAISFSYAWNGTTGNYTVTCNNGTVSK